MLIELQAVIFWLMNWPLGWLFFCRCWPVAISRDCGSVPTTMSLSVTAPPITACHQNWTCHCYITNCYCLPPMSPSVIVPPITACHQHWTCHCDRAWKYYIFIFKINSIENKSSQLSNLEYCWKLCAVFLLFIITNILLINQHFGFLQMPSCW